MRTKWFRVLLRRRIQVALLLILQIAFLIWLLYGGVIQSRIVDVLLTVVSFAVALHVVSKRDKGAYKIAWLFIILLFPPAGGIFYLLCHVQRSTRRFRRDIETINDKTRQSFLLCGDKLGEFSQAHPQQETSVAYLQHYAGFPVFDRTKTRYLTPGEEFFPVLLEELEKAEHYIFFEYFIVQEGKMWNAILDVLKRKAAQGVKVRVMYDDMGCFFLLPKDYRKTLESYGIECAVFNPFRPLLTAMQNNRDHRKITSIDGRVAFTLEGRTLRGFFRRLGAALWRQSDGRGACQRARLYAAVQPRPKLYLYQHAVSDPGRQYAFGVGTGGQKRRGRAHRHAPCVG